MQASTVGFVKSVNKISATDTGVDWHYDYGERDIDTGFVIYELTDSEKEIDMTGSSVIIDDTNKATAQATRNQYVWVPVYDVNDIYGIDANGNYYSKLYNFNSSGRSAYKYPYDSHYGRPIYYEPAVLENYDNEENLFLNGLEAYTKDILYQEINRDYERMIDSIVQYGGFYIGRYETGNLSRRNNNEFKNVKGNTDISNKSWYYYYKYKNFSSENSYISTSMIWENLWCRTVQWLYDTGNRTYEELGGNCSSFGNFASTSLRFINTSNNITTKARMTSEKIPSGSSEQTKTNNFYDFAGNIEEWTMGSSVVNSWRSNSSGCYALANSEGLSIAAGVGPDRSSIDRGFRSCMIIKPTEV